MKQFEYDSDLSELCSVALQGKVEDYKNFYWSARTSYLQRILEKLSKHSYSRFSRTFFTSLFPVMRSGLIGIRGYRAGEYDIKSNKHLTGSLSVPSRLFWQEYCKDASSTHQALYEQEGNVRYVEIV